MSLHQWNRFSEHADLSKLTPAQVLVAKELSMRTNGTKADLMRLGVEYIAGATGLSVTTTEKAIKALLAQEIFTATQKNRRSARVFTLLVDCPAECKQREKHYSPAEKKALAEVNKTPEPVNLTPDLDTPRTIVSDSLTPENWGTNRELNKELNKDLNTREIEPVTALVSEPLESVLVSLSQWEKICSDTISRLHQADLTAAHKAIAANPGKYHSTALAFLNEAATKTAISSYPGYLARVFKANPQSLMAADNATRKDLKALDDFLRNKFANEFSFRDPYTNEFKHDYTRLRADLLEQPEAAEWLETIGKFGTVNSQKLAPVIDRLLSSNPKAYERSESQQTA